jgi:hypothetical protein
MEHFMNKGMAGDVVAETITEVCLGVGTRDFHLGDVLAVVKNDPNLSPNGMNGVLRLLSHMAGREVYSNQIQVASKICGPALLEQFVDMGLENADVLSLEEKKQHVLSVGPTQRTMNQIYRAWRYDQTEKFGATTLCVAPLNDPLCLDPIGGKVKDRTNANRPDDLRDFRERRGATNAKHQLRA